MRRLSEEQSKALIKRYRPLRTKLRWKRGRRWKPAHAMRLEFDRFEILSPYPDTPFRALVFLHECAHIRNGDWCHADHDHVAEYMAECTAMSWWRQQGYRVPKRYINSARYYIRRCIAADRKKGIKIKAHIARFAKKR